VKRVLRILLNSLTVLSLLVCLATVVMWVRGNQKADILAYHSNHALHRLLNSQAGLQYTYISEDLTDPRTLRYTCMLSFFHGWHYYRDISRNGGSGFHFETGRNPFQFDIGLPYWLICLITALIPAARLTARLRRKRPPPGLCPKCRYDLRATPDRCPECGTVSQQLLLCP